MAERNFDWEIVLDGEIVTRGKLLKAYRFWKKYHLMGGETRCPLCDSDLEENGVFVCEKCCEILPLEEKCKNSEHNHNGDCCEDCCVESSDDKSYEEALNTRIDKMRGK